MFKKAILILALLALGGCKLAVIVVEGGEVQSDFGTCQSTTPGTTGNVCIYEVTTTKSFTAVPAVGWHFVKWNSGGDFLCKDSADPICDVMDVGALFEPPVAPDKTFYIMPIFEEGPDTITVDGRVWAQVDLFVGLSWNDINAVCPAGVCAGVLNSYNMSGWEWASVEDVNDLFNYYIGTDELGPSPEQYYEEESLWAPAPFADGWRDTDDGCCSYQTLFGHSASDTGSFSYSPRIVDWYNTNPDVAETNLLLQKYSSSVGIGAWFYRTPE